MSVCEHPGFKASVEVGRLTDGAGNVHAFTADVRVECAVCGLPFEFMGMPEGLSPSVPTRSVDGLEARLPIQPQLRSELLGPLWPSPRRGSPVLVHRND